MSSYMPKAKSDVHITPDRVFDLIYEYYGYGKDDLFDPCPLNTKHDGLEISWHDINFVNPPYTLLSEFVQKALDELPKKTILLLPSKTDQGWFHNLYNYWGRIIWIKGRLKFKNNKFSATQPHFLIMID